MNQFKRVNVEESTAINGLMEDKLIKGNLGQIKSQTARSEKNIKSWTVIKMKESVLFSIMRFMTKRQKA